jgi:secreted PhoX family phosphatase
VSATLRLVYEARSEAVLDLPDNIAASRAGALVLCEDGSGDNFLRGLTRRGTLFNFARNVDPAQPGQEFAGARFSRDFTTLFVNIQSSTGYSIAIWGPWHKGPFG